MYKATREFYYQLCKIEPCIGLDAFNRSTFISSTPILLEGILKISKCQVCVISSIPQFSIIDGVPQFSVCYDRGVINIDEDKVIICHLLQIVGKEQ